MVSRCEVHYTIYPSYNQPSDYRGWPDTSTFALRLLVHLLHYRFLHFFLLFTSSFFRPAPLVSSPPHQFLLLWTKRIYASLPAQPFPVIPAQSVGDLSLGCDAHGEPVSDLCPDFSHTSRPDPVLLGERGLQSEESTFAAVHQWQAEQWAWQSDYFWVRRSSFTAHAGAHTSSYTTPYRRRMDARAVWSRSINKTHSYEDIPFYFMYYPPLFFLFVDEEDFCSRMSLPLPPFSPSDIFMPSLHPANLTVLLRKIRVKYIWLKKVFKTKENK